MTPPTRLFQIYEDDLATLEKSLPELAQALMPVLTNRSRVQLRTVQRILSSVRWNYGPPSDVEVIHADGGPAVDQAS